MTDIVNWCGLDNNPKSETICLNFSPSRIRLTEGNSLGISGRVTAKEKQFKLLSLGLMLSVHLDPKRHYQEEASVQLKPQANNYYKKICELFEGFFYMFLI